MIGQKLGPYEVLAKIGAGGMSEVYRARDAKLGRDVAIKILPYVLVGDAATMRVVVNWVEELKQKLPK